MRRRHVAFAVPHGICIALRVPKRRAKKSAKKRAKRVKRGTQGMHKACARQALLQTPLPVVNLRVLCLAAAVLLRLAPQ